LQDYGDVISASCVCWTSVFHAREGEYRKGKWEWSAAGIPDEKKSAAKLWGRSDSSHFEEGQVKKEIRNSVGNGARAPKHPCSVSGFSFHVLRYSHAPRCTTPPAARRERRGRGKNERENPSSRGGGECLAGPVAVPAHGGCEAKPPEADEEGKGASRKVSAFSFRRPHQCHTALLSE